MKGSSNDTLRNDTKIFVIPLQCTTVLEVTRTKIEERHIDHCLFIGPWMFDSKNVWLEEGKENLEIGIVLVNDDVQNNTTM
jgi:hypothetical protein